MSKRKKLVFIRLDRIGDLVLTLPVDQHPDLVGSEIFWIIQKGLEFIPRFSTPARKFETIDKNRPWSSFWKLVSILSRETPEAVVIFHGPWWLSLAALVARVRHRFGRRSQWHSFLFLNGGVRQKRSRAEVHELEYNFQLVEKTLKLTHYGKPKSLSLRLIAPDVPVGVSVPSEYVVVHAGMGGSAANWPVENYVELIRRISSSCSVVCTGTKMDSAVVEILKQNFLNSPRVVFLDGMLDAQQLLKVLSNTRTLVAPSTGVAQLAASLGVPVVGLYSQIQNEKAMRWGPLGPSVHVLEGTPSAHDAAGLKQVSVDTVESKVRSLINHGGM